MSQNCANRAASPPLSSFPVCQWCFPRSPDVLDRRCLTGFIPPHQPLPFPFSRTHTPPDKTASALLLSSSSMGNSTRRRPRPTGTNCSAPSTISLFFPLPNKPTIGVDDRDRFSTAVLHSILRSSWVPLFLYLYTICLTYSVPFVAPFCETSLVPFLLQSIPFVIDACSVCTLGCVRWVAGCIYHSLLVSTPNPPLPPLHPPFCLCNPQCSSLPSSGARFCASVPPLFCASSQFRFSSSSSLYYPHCWR